MSGERNGIHLIKEETLMELFNLIFNMKERVREKEESIFIIVHVLIIKCNSNQVEKEEEEVRNFSLVLWISL